MVTPIKEHNMSTAETVEVKCKHHVGPRRKLCGAVRLVAPQDVLQVKARHRTSEGVRG